MRHRPDLDKIKYSFENQNKHTISCTLFNTVELVVLSSFNADELCTVYL